MSVRQEILDKAMALFLKVGIKSVSMDDVARELGRSKKTLYQYFPNKRSLVETVTRTYHKRHQKELQQIHEEAENAIEQWFQIFRHNCQRMSSINPTVIHDIRKYYPESWKIFQAHKDTFILDMVRQNLERGIEEGLYRADLDPQIVARIYTSRVETMVSDDLWPKPEYDMNCVFAEYMNYHLRGIATPKGLELMESLNINE